MHTRKTSDFQCTRGGVSDHAEGGFSGMSQHAAFVPVLLVVPIKVMGLIDLAIDCKNNNITIVSL